MLLNAFKTTVSNLLKPKRGSLPALWPTENKKNNKSEMPSMTFPTKLALTSLKTWTYLKTNLKKKQPSADIWKMWNKLDWQRKANSTPRFTGV